LVSLATSNLTKYLLDLNPNEPAFYTNRAIAFLKIERFDEA
jgi:tetratricopeptide (TPR) repeat protein